MCSWAGRGRGCGDPAEGSRRVPALSIAARSAVGQRRRPSRTVRRPASRCWAPAGRRRAFSWTVKTQVSLVS